MEGLFSGNLAILYVLGCMAVISYTHFEENQHIFLFYIFTYSAALLGVFRIAVCLLLLGAVTFAYLEYLSSDKRKLTLVTKVRYKILDYGFMMVSQYAFFWIMAAFVMLHISHYDAVCIRGKLAAMILSVIFLCTGAHKTICQPFKIKTFTEMLRIFDQYPPYAFQYTEQMQLRFDLLCAVEDKTYFLRKKSYSSFSWEYVWTSIRRKAPMGVRPIKLALGTLGGRKKAAQRIKRFLKRGHSTPEMQIIRSIGIQRGYDRYKIQRKLFEIFYSNIFFASLKQFHQKNSFVKLDHFRHYLLSVYFEAVEIRIHKKRYDPMASAFENPKDYSNWSMEGLFVACYALSRWTMTDQKLDAFSDIIAEFGLNRTEIKKLYNQFPKKKLPSGNYERKSVPMA